MSTVVLTLNHSAIFMADCQTISLEQKKTGGAASGLVTENCFAYLLPPLTAGAVAPIVSGRFNSSVSSVPAGNVAERCLASQCTVVEVAPERRTAGLG